MPRKEPRKMRLRELMGLLGDAQPGSIARPPLEAEFERGKLVLQRWAVVIAGLGVLFAVAYYLGLLEALRNHFSK